MTIPRIADLPTSTKKTIPNFNSHNINDRMTVKRPIPSSVTIVNESTPLISQQGTVSFTLNRHDPHQRNKELAGLIFLVLSALSFTAMTVCVKLASENKIGSFEIVFIRSLVQLVLSLVACGVKRIHPFGKAGCRRWLLLRAFTMSVGLALFFYSLTVLPLVDSTVLFSLGPVFTAVIGSIVLDERFTSYDAMCAISCLFGVFLVTKPGILFVYTRHPMIVSSSSQLGIECVCAGAIMSAFSNVLVRKIGKETHFLVHSVYFGAMSCLISPPGLLVFQKILLPTNGDWMIPLVLILVGVFAFVGQCLLNQGLKKAPPALGIIISGSDIVFTWLAGMLVFHEYADGQTLFGSMIILVMTTTLGLHKLKRRTIRSAANKAARKRQSRERLVAPPGQPQQ
ncbi:hypothetical protein BC941DRAFT_413971 [Chlamydoabsidia padenii]|nr:hypothetical protein BC941DRAFT_413971 [Chlamydoabsidia padenii]